MSNLNEWKTELEAQLKSALEEKAEKYNISQSRNNKLWSNWYVVINQAVSAANSIPSNSTMIEIERSNDFSLKAWIELRWVHYTTDGRVKREPLRLSVKDQEFVHYSELASDLPALSLDNASDEEVRSMVSRFIILKYRKMQGLE